MAASPASHPRGERHLDRRVPCARRGLGVRPGRAGSPRAGDAARHGDQPAVGRHRGHARHLHAGRVCARGDRLLPGEARRPRGQHELRHLRHRRSSHSFRRVPTRLRRLQLRRLRHGCPDERGRPARLGQLGVPLAGRLGDVRRRHHARRARRSSSTWWRSWTPWRRSRPARWRSGGSGTASSCGGCSAARSTTRCSRRGHGVAAGSPSRGTRWASEPATSTSPAPAWSTRSAASLRSPARRCSDPASASSARTASHAPSPATTSRWHCSARSSSCSGGSASTPPRPSLPPTCSSPSSLPTRRSRQRSARRARWSTSATSASRASASPIPA